MYVVSVCIRARFLMHITTLSGRAGRVMLMRGAVATIPLGRASVQDDADNNCMMRTVASEQAFVLLI